MGLPFFKDPSQTLMLLQTKWKQILDPVVNAAFPSFTNYIPTTQGFGSIGLSFCRYAVIGNLCVIEACFLSGTPSSAAAQFGLPPNVFLDLPLNQIVSGQLVCGSAYTANVSATFSGQLLPLISPGQTFLQFGTVQVNVNPFTIQAGSSFAAASKLVSLSVVLPVT